VIPSAFLVAVSKRKRNDDEFTELEMLAVLASLGALNAAYAQVEQPSGTIEIASTSVAAGVGVVWGDGRSITGDANYGFSIQGLSVVDVGISSITTTGEVFDLKNPQDLAGNYVAGAAGLALAGGGDASSCRTIVAWFCGFMARRRAYVFSWRARACRSS